MLLNATTSTVPLAPAAPLPVSQSWRSPKPTVMLTRHHHQRRRQDRGDAGDGDGDDDEFNHGSTPLHRRQRQQQRYRSTSFDDTTGTAFGKTSSSHLNLDKESASKIYHPVGDILPAPIDDGHQNSLLASFLLHLNSFLPEYCQHLASVSEDSANAITCASMAIGVLERGADTLYRTFGIANHVNKIHETNTGGASTSAPSSPLLSHQRTNMSPQTPTPIRSKWRNSPIQKKFLLSPPQQSATYVVSGGMIKWNNAIVETEWERFVAPFINLAGAECLYNRMEHVLDPERCNTEASVMAKGGGTKPKRIERKEKPSSSSFDRQDHTSSISSQRHTHPPHILPHTAPLDTSKLGSRRLIATYRQIREDLIIVGEYLCDSVLGSRVDDTTTTSSSNYTVPSSMSAVSNLLPFPPLVSDRISPTSSAMRSKSLTLTPLSSSPSESHDNHMISKIRSAEINNYNERRELAAISFRETLDALIRFIDARCVLIRTHAVLCSQQKLSPLCIPATGEIKDVHSQSIHTNQVSDAGREKHKWSVLAEQCRHVVHPLTVLGAMDDDRCIPKRAVSNIEKEVRCLELALTSIHTLLEFE